MYPVADSHLELTAHFCDFAETGLRAGDALHLAIAQDHGATVCTRDRGLATAGLTLGIDTILIEARTH
jgi:predicted nucleic acid-binding protein